MPAWSNRGMLRFAVPALLLLLAVPPAFAEGPPPATCRGDLAGLDATFEETLQRLDTAWKSEDNAQKCAAISHHIDVMRHAAEVFDVCTTGRGREENMGQALGTIADFQDIASDIGCP